MATDELHAAWNSYEEAVRAFYERFGLEQFLEDVEAADELLGETVEAAERLTDVAAGLLETVDREQRESLTTLVLAAAAVDIGVACDVLARDPERPQVGETAEVTPVHPTFLLEEASRLFRAEGLPPMAGAQEEPHSVWRDCDSAFDELVAAAYEPASDFAGDLVSGGMTGLGHVVASDLFPRLARLTRSVGLLKRPAVKLLTTGMHKMLSTSMSTAGELLGNALDFLDEAAVQALKAALRDRLERLLGFVGGRGPASREVLAALQLRGPPNPQLVVSIRRQLGDLTRRYRDQMRWTGWIAQLIGFVSPLLKLLAVPTSGGGPALVLVLDGFGLGFVVCTLRMRITGRFLSHRVDGVVTIVT